MADKAVVYSKWGDEPSVPVTARIEWLPDGTIKPCLYWMPDGSCYKIERIVETIPLAYLQDRGEGVRFRVKSVVIEAPEPYSDYRFTRHETYLHFADNFFCGENMVDGRYGHEGKEFIPVTLDIFPNGQYKLIYFEVQGNRYMVEKTVAIEPRGSFHAGGVGVWHKVEARQINADNDDDPDPLKSNIRIAALYFEINKWFVSVTHSDEHK